MRNDTSNVARDWDTYWQGSADGTAFANDGVDHPLVRDFWHRSLATLRPADAKLRLLDVASGKGAVIDVVRELFGDDGIAVSCLDTSASAIGSLVERFPLAEGVVADARDMPFPDGSFDIATSQFGVEYAGLDAVGEVARVIAPGGTMLCLMHLEGSLIDRECSGNMQAINDLDEIGFFGAAIRLFSEGRKCIRGETNGSRAEYDAAVAAMVPVFRELGTLVEQHGEGIAGGTLATLHRETDRIYGRIMHHDLDEVLQWLQRMSDELVAYKGRMQSMSDAASSPSAFEALATGLGDKGFDILQSAPLRDDAGGNDIAWQLVARRSAE